MELVPFPGFNPANRVKSEGVAGGKRVAEFAKEWKEGKRSHLGNKKVCFCTEEETICDWIPPVRHGEDE